MTRPVGFCPELTNQVTPEVTPENAKRVIVLRTLREEGQIIWSESLREEI
jgi:hypothetical protein